MAWIKLDNGTYLDPSCIKEIECRCTILCDQENGTYKKNGARVNRSKVYNKLEVLAKDSTEKDSGVVVYSTSFPVPDITVPEPGCDPEIPIETRLTTRVIAKHVINCLEEAEESDEEVIRFKKLVESRKIII